MPRQGFFDKWVCLALVSLQERVVLACRSRRSLLLEGELVQAELLVHCLLDRVDTCFIDELALFKQSLDVYKKVPVVNFAIVGFH